MGIRSAKLKAVGVAIALIAITTQLAYIAYYWWTFDPRLSCDRLHGWDEWLECLHGRSHAYVTTTEGALASWAVASVALLLGRYLSPYLSILLPALTVLAWGSHLRHFWHDAFVAYAPFGETTFKDALAFAKAALPTTIFYVGPIAGTWPLGIHLRNRPHNRNIPEVFD